MRRIRLVLARGALGPLRAGSCDRFAARPSVSANLIAYGDRRIALVRSASPARLPSASLRRISLQSRDCLRVRVLHSCTPSSRRQPCFPAFPAVARGALLLRFARSARHLAVTSLRSCARLRLRGYPPLRFGAFTLGCSSAVRCVLHSRMHTAWLGVEYHILRQSAHLRGALRIPSLERSRVSCRASPCSVALSVATFPIYYCGASCAL